MNSAKPSPNETTKERQARDIREYERLVAEIKAHLEHRSPGIWDWWDDTVEVVTEAADDAWDWINDVVDDGADTVSHLVDDGWDTASNWIDGVVNTAGEWVDDGWEWVNDVVDSYVWDTTEAEGVVESWVRDTFDIPDQAGKGFIGELWDKIGDDWDENVEELEDLYNKAAKTASDVAEGIGEGASGVVEAAGMALGIGFDAAMAGLAGLLPLLTEWREALAKWFDFDIEKFITMWKDAEDKMKGVKRD